MNILTYFIIVYYSIKSFSVEVPSPTCQYLACCLNLEFVAQFKIIQLARPNIIWTLFTLTFVSQHFLKGARSRPGQLSVLGIKDNANFRVHLRVAGTVRCRRCDTDTMLALTHGGKKGRNVQCIVMPVRCLLRRDDCSVTQPTTYGSVARSQHNAIERTIYAKCQIEVNRQYTT